MWNQTIQRVLLCCVLVVGILSLQGCGSSDELETAFDYASSEQIQAARERDRQEENEAELENEEMEDEE